MKRRRVPTLLLAPLALLAACCPAPAGATSAAPGTPGLPEATLGADARLAVRTAAGPAAPDGARTARSEDGSVLWLVPEGALLLPADARLYVAGRWASDGTLRVTSAAALPDDPPAR